ncbi:TPA: hypothetical protein U0J84_001655 [Streptococcus suis]|nr:hypothetical protein [Streptococcus suis]HEL9591011.1 hypothetical protein [Streptococcus suis]
MTLLELTFLTIALLSVTWMAVIWVWALRLVRKYREQVEYYQHPNVQCQIARHVLKYGWYSKGGEVFR